MLLHPAQPARPAASNDPRSVVVDTDIRMPPSRTDERIRAAAWLRRSSLSTDLEGLDLVVSQM